MLPGNNSVRSIGNIVDLQICSWACHSSARLPCASFGGDPSSYLDGAKDTASRSLQCLLNNQALIQIISVMHVIALAFNEILILHCTICYV